MDFISIPLVVGIVTLGIYKLFELFARRKERLTLIEKMGDKIDPSLLNSQISLPSFKNLSGSFVTLRFACLLLGVGLGLLIGYFIVTGTVPYNTEEESWHYREAAGMVYGASTLLFGGLGLLAAFLLEMKHRGKDEN